MITCGVSDALFIDPYDKVFTLTTVSINQYSPILKRNILCSLEGLPNAAQVSAAESNSHSAILDREGRVWMLGLNSYSQLGISSEEYYLFSPARVLNLPQIIMVSCGSRHSLALDIEGHIWGAGDNREGQLNQKGVDKIEHFSRIITSEDIGRITKICCGGCHNVVQSETELWSNGLNDHGQLGIGNTQSKSRFQKISVEPGFLVHTFDCGLQHTVVLDVSGRVWTTGQGSTGALGLGDINDRISLTEILNIPPMVYISCSSNITLMKDNNGKVYGTGCLKSRTTDLHVNVTQAIFPQLLFDSPAIALACASLYCCLLVDYDGGVWIGKYCPLFWNGNFSNTEVNRFARLHDDSNTLTVNTTFGDQRFLTTKRAQ